MRKEICSITVIGLVIPLAKNSSQSLSTLFRRGPVIILRASCGLAGGCARIEVNLLNNLENLILVGILEYTAQAVRIDRGEWRLPQLLDGNETVSGNVILEQVKESDLIRR